MVNRTTLTALAALEREMDQTGRAREKAALQEALEALSHSARGFLTAKQAAESLGVPPATIKCWIERGALIGGALGGSMIVSQDSVDRLVHLRDSLIAMDREGNPTPDEVAVLSPQGDRSAREQRGAR